MNKPQRNDPCPCGSGRKYKQCCLSKAQAAPAAGAGQVVGMMQSAIELHGSGRLAEAEVVYRRVVGVAPRQADAWYGLGHVYNQQGRLPEAVAVLRKALEANPRHARAHNTLGMALDGLGEFEEAIACYRKALRLDSGFFEAQYNLGSCLLTLGRIDEAVHCLERAVTIQPGRGLAQMTLGQALVSQGDVVRAMASIRRALALLPDFALAHDLYLTTMNYLPGSPEAIAAAHSAYGERIEAPLRPAWPVHRNDRDPRRRLKVGYVSPDFRTHSVATFIEPILAHHDRAAFEVFGYYSGVVHDAVTERIGGHMDHWLSCATMSDTQLAERISLDGIDILVDLAGHTRDNRLLVFARRPAPVQVTYLGYPATTGLTAMDYRLVTADTDPPGAEAWHTERLWRLPRTLWCYRPSPGTPDVEPETPMHRQGAIRFISANNVAKLSDAVVATWSRLLEAVPGAILVISGIAEGTAQRLLREGFVARGIGAGRVIVHDKRPAREFWTLLKESDIALDPFPYNGTTTTCELLWMGIPLVTLTGETSVARSGYALLKTVGLEELCARDAADYVRIATELAKDTNRLANLRAGLRDRVATSPLRDEEGVCREIEAAYRSMWEGWCGGEQKILSTEHTEGTEKAKE